MGTVFSKEEKMLRKAQKILDSGLIETENDKKLYGELLLEYKNLLNQTERVVKISDIIGGKLNSVLHDIDEISKIDYLTNLYNRRYFDEVLLREWENAENSQRLLSVLMIDVDWFKSYNDMNGHIKGDKTLQKIAQAIKDELEDKQSIVARYGGEEFVVLMLDLDESEAQAAAEKVRVGVEKLNIVHIGAGKHKMITISIGVATNQNQSFDCYEKLLNTADKALYNAKKFGRNRVELYKDIKEG